MPERVHPMPGQMLAWVELDREQGGYGDQPVPTDDLDAANLLTSRIDGTDWHRPVLDLDMHAQLLPSSTPGHFHLLINEKMPWDAYCHLLDALAMAGVLEPGYVNASRERGYTAVRLPWVRKA